MYDHYDMTQRVDLDKYNESLWEIEELKERISVLEEDIEYYKEKDNKKDEIIEDLYKEIRKINAKNMEKNNIN